MTLSLLRIGILLYAFADEPPYLGITLLSILLCPIEHLLHLAVSLLPHSHLLACICQILGGCFKVSGQLLSPTRKLLILIFQALYIISQFGDLLLCGLILRLLRNQFALQSNFSVLKNLNLT